MDIRANRIRFSKRPARRLAGWGISLCAIALAATGCTNPHTPAGHEGYVFEQPRMIGEGGFRGIIKGPGNFGLSPLRNEVVNIDMRPQTYDENLKILAKDDLNIVLHFHMVIELEDGSIQAVIEDYGGEDWYKRFVMEPFRTYIRNSVQHYTSRDIKAQRSTIAGDVRTQLGKHLAGSPFKLVSLVVGNIDYPPAVATAVEKKLAAQQLLEEKAVQKSIAQRDAEIKVEEAKGIAEAQRIINQTLTQNYLQHEAIAAQSLMAGSPNHTTVYIPVGNNGIPLVNTVDK
jgi:regulator of protease activity HflC (stomatin/prohibitin superfamily)